MRRIEQRRVYSLEFPRGTRRLVQQPESGNSRPSHKEWLGNHDLSTAKTGEWRHDNRLSTSVPLAGNKTVMMLRGTDGRAGAISKRISIPSEDLDV